MQFCPSLRYAMVAVQCSALFHCSSSIAVAVTEDAVLKRVCHRRTSVITNAVRVFAAAVIGSENDGNDDDSDDDSNR